MSTIIQKIKDAAKIEDILIYGLGVELHREGAGYTALCPFHEDKHLGSFKVSPSKNICRCFSCGKTWKPIEALMDGQGIDYITALHWIAAHYKIIIDDTISNSRPVRPKAKQLPIFYIPESYVEARLGNCDQNPLLTYLTNLPLSTEQKIRLKEMIQLYRVGTSTARATAGWSIWWQIDDKGNARTGKLMKYLTNGHRNKTSRYSFNFVHAMMKHVGMYDDTKYRIESCLFGLHLVDKYPQADICIVESEKSALICSAFTAPDKQLWLATSGKNGLNRKKLQPLINRNCKIIIYPDKDGFEEWRLMANKIEYSKLTVSQEVNDLWKPEDGEKADIADIFIRQLNNN